MTVSFIQRNVVKKTSGGASTVTVPFHSSAAASDLQMLCISNASGITPSAPSGSGWTLLFSRSNTYSALFIYTRAIISGDLSSNITFTGQDYTNAELRTYRATDGEVFSVDSSGDGLVAGSTTVRGWLIRCWASAQINTSGGSGKNLVGPVLTGPTVVSATANSSFSGEGPDNAFDLDPGTTWTCTAGPTGWVQAQLSSAVAATSYKIAGRAGWDGRNPTAWTVQGSNDGSSWTTLDTRTGQTVSSNTLYTFTFSNSTAYLYYRFNLTANAGDPGICNLTEFQIAGVNVSTPILLNAPTSTSYNWYDGGLFGDDPVTSGASGTSTATHTGGGETITPQWANVLLQVTASFASGVSSADATGTTTSAPSTGGAAGSSSAGVTGAGPSVLLSGLAGSGGSDYQLSRRIAIAVALAEETDAPRAPGVYIPSGDRYGDARIISGSNGTLALSFTGAGTETGEPLPTGVTKTLWLLWETDEQTNPRVIFDTGVASIVIGDDDPAIAGFSSVWDGEGGVAAYPNALSFYKVQLGWRTGDPPDFTLTWESDDPPFYDEFSTPYEMAGDEDRANLSTEFCTLQPSEPVAVGTQTSAWSRWEPSSSGEAILETSDPALIIRVYEDGVDITSLTLVTSGTGSVTFTATDPAYLIQICDTTEPGA